MIYFYGSLEKSERTYPDVIRRLRRMLEREEPELIKFTAGALKNQQNSVTYSDLRESRCNTVK